MIQYIESEDLLGACDFFEGYDLFGEIISGDLVRVGDRDDLETDPFKRQLIPYCILRNEYGEYLTYGRKGKEERLHGLRSLGVGGHLESGESIYSGMSREIFEETGLENYDSRHLGFIALEDSLVNQVHLGIVFLITGFSLSEFNPGDELLEYAWESVPVGNFEPWSQLLIEKGLLNNVI